jgi:hypothetical protein
LLKEATMDLDVDTLVTAVYCIVDDRYRAQFAPLKPARPGQRPVLSDSEILTLAILAQRTLFRWLLRLGLALLRLFFLTGTAARPGRPTLGRPRPALDDLRFRLRQTDVRAARPLRAWPAHRLPIGRQLEPTATVLLGPAARMDGLWQH